MVYHYYGYCSLYLSRLYVYDVYLVLYCYYDM